MKNKNGLNLFKGKRLINNKKIVVIVTGLNAKTMNEKTGNMLQTWILHDDMEPHKAFKIKEYGETVCGNCPHAGYNNNSCYVKWFQAPLNVYRAYKNNKYNYFNGDYEIFRNKSIRFGSCGDPSLIPLYMVKKMIDVCKNHTGYTHQWSNYFGIRFKGLFQASVDSFDEYLKASSLGFKCFYVKHESIEDPKNFIHCMASIEKGKKTNCNTCNLCDGSKADIVINAHGNTKNNVLLNV